MKNRIALRLLILLALVPLLLGRFAMAQPAPSSAGAAPAPSGAASSATPPAAPDPISAPPPGASGSVPPAGAVSSSASAPGQPAVSGRPDRPSATAPPVQPAGDLPAPAAPPLAVQSAPPSPHSPPRQLAGRVGFGIGLYATPIAGIAPAVGTSGAPGTSGGLPGVGFGGLLGIRAWVSERIALLPSLQMSISHTSAPPTTHVLGGWIEAANFTSGLFASSLSIGFAAYRGHSTRFVLSGGLRFGYSVQVQLAGAGTGTVYEYEPVRTVSFAVPAGFALEQLFTPRISIVVGAESPLLSYSSEKAGTEDPTTTVGADFASTRLGASVFFYTD